MSDQSFTLIDSRGRAAAAAIRAEATFRATSGVSVAPARSAHRAWLRPALWLTVAAAMVVGLVMVVTRGDDAAVNHDPRGLRYVIGDLPDRWKPVSVKDAGVETAPDVYEAQVALYGTPGDPSVASLQLEVSSHAHLSNVMIFAADVRAFTVGDGDAGCGVVFNDWLFCDVELPQGVVEVRAKQLSFESVVTALQTLRLVDGSPRLDEAALPAGVGFVAAGDVNMVSVIAVGNADSAEVSSVQYGGADGETYTLVSGWADRQEIASSGVLEDYARQPLGDGSAYWAARSGALVWVRDGRVFLLQGAGLDLRTALLAAASVRSASTAEWEGIPRRGSAAGTQETVGPVTTTGSTTGPVVNPAEQPPPTLAPGTAVVDVSVTQIMVAATPDDADFSVRLPDGSVGPITVIQIGDQLEVRSPTGGGGFHLPSVPDPFIQVLGGDGHSGVAVFTKSTTAAQIRVTRSNGERYVMGFVEMTSHPGLYIAVLPLPANTMVHADVVDADGNVLAATD